jgi:hypothetical protein
VPQADDISAIDRYITTAPIVTPAAQAAKEAWIQWNDGVSFYDRTFDRATYDHARNLRLAFQLANATTDAERGQVLDVALHGMSAEQSQGEADRRDSTGHYSEKSPGSDLSRFVLWGLGALGVVALAKRTLLK